MMSLLSSVSGLVFAADEAASSVTEKIEYDLPKTFEQWLLYFVIGVAILCYVGWMYIKDTRTMNFFWRGWLLLLRVAVLAGLAVIFFNPHNRKRTTNHEPSKVAVVMDKSLSMRFAAKDGSDETTRSEAIAELMAKSPFLKNLSKNQQVKFYFFGETFSPGPVDLQPENDPRAQDAKAAVAKTEEDDTATEEEGERVSIDKLSKDEAYKYWLEKLKPTDAVTRVSGALESLMEEDVHGKTYAGIVLITDGGDGVYGNLITKANSHKMKIFPVGVGGVQSIPNLQITNLEAPEEVHTKDKFEVTAWIQAQTLKKQTSEDEDAPNLLEGKTAKVTLTMERDQGGSFVPYGKTMVEEIVLGKDGVPVKVNFEQKEVPEPVKLRFKVKAELVDAEPEFKLDDNEKSATTTVSNKRTRVLLVAGGPMRDYRFLSNIVSRNPSFRARAFLQTVDPSTFDSVSQSVELIPEFPATMEELNGSGTEESADKGYDVIVFFDPDWRSLLDLQPNVLPLLQRWVGEFSGGVVFVAGDVFTHDLARSSDDQGGLKPVHTLMPVYLNPHTFDFINLESDFDEAARVKLTDTGYISEFLQVTEQPSENRDFWDEEFEGVYRTYPTAGAKPGATIYANTEDNRLDGGEGSPVFLASQMYGSGKALYLGSGETWRMRSLSNTYHERFWTKLIREAGEGRRSKGRSPVNLFLEKEYNHDDFIRVRAEVLDGAFQPTEMESVKLHLFDENNDEIFPEPVLAPDPSRKGEYAGIFPIEELGLDPGWYSLKIPVPGTESYRQREFQVVYRDSEDVNTQLKVKELRNLAKDTGGKYFPLDSAAQDLASVLQIKHDTQVTDEIETLWDRDWVMYALIAVLSMEWLTRKLLKLA